MTKNELFLELAKPNVQGVSRWVRVTEFVGKYADLAFGNGASCQICPMHLKNWIKVCMR